MSENNEIEVMEMPVESPLKVVTKSELEDQDVKKLEEDFEALKTEYKKMAEEFYNMKFRFGEETETRVETFKLEKALTNFLVEKAEWYFKESLDLEYLMNSLEEQRAELNSSKADGIYLEPLTIDFLYKVFNRYKGVGIQEAREFNTLLHAIDKTFIAFNPHKEKMVQLSEKVQTAEMDFLEALEKIGRKNGKDLQ